MTRGKKWWFQAVAAVLLWLAPLGSSAHAGTFDWVSSAFDRIFSSRSPKLIVLLYDVTKSTNGEADHQIYHSTIQALVETLRPGDRVVVGLISATPMSRSAPVKNLSCRDTGVEIDDGECLDRLKRELLQTLARLSQGRTAVQTYLLDSFWFAQQIIEADKRERRWIVVLSDMIEDSPGLSFDRIRFDDRRIPEMTQGLRSQRRLPNLHGAKIFVAGAGGKDRDHYLGIRGFRMEYFRQANGFCGLGMYGRVIPHFPSD